jgi:hypothetical protein
MTYDDLIEIDDAEVIDLGDVSEVTAGSAGPNSELIFQNCEN